MVEAGQRVESADVIWTVASDLSVAQRPEDLSQTKLNKCFPELGTVIEVSDVCGGFAEFTENSAAILLAEVFLVAVIFPAGDVHLRKRVGERRLSGLIELLNDGFVSESIIQHGVDLIAEGSGEAGDSAVAAAFGFSRVGVGELRVWELVSWGVKSLRV